MKKLILIAAAAVLARAHFVFVVPAADRSTANVFISETLEPDSQVDVNLVKDTKLSLRSGAKDTALTLTNAGAAYSTKLSGSGVIHGIADLGVSGEGGKSYLLVYHPKTILGNAFDTKALDAAVELVPSGKAGAMTLKLLAHGKPLADAEITVILPGGKQKKVKTNQMGETESFTERGRYGAWARSWEQTPGERDGKKYAEVHNYATIVFDVPALTLPQASASLGAVASGGWLYAYGGHIAPTHLYYVGAVSGRFDRLRLAGDPVWEELPGGPPLQGMNLAAHNGKIYLVGGMSPQNTKGQKSENISVADVSRFDPATKRWDALPPMPEPRSSHDVAVIGDKLFVTGGWRMNGKADSTWSDTTLLMDLSAAKPEWQKIPQPFHRRALIAAELDGKLYVMGGINDKEEVVRTVSIYDPQTKTWSEGPQLPEGRILGFAPAAVVHKGALYISVADGSLLKLDGAAWVKAGQGSPRVAHRLVSSGDSILVLGGAENGKNLDLIEKITP